jgi:hypothetical protein
MVLLEEKLEFFKENGYWIEHGALSEAEVAAVLAGATQIGSGGSAPKLLQDTKAFDALAYHPSVYPFAQRVLGGEASLSGLSYGDARPNATPPPADPYAEDDTLVLNRAWHREDSGNIEGADANEYFCPAMQVIFYLDDVDERNYCTSVIPESAAAKRSLPTTRLPLERDGRHHDGLLRLYDFGPYGKAGNYVGGAYHTPVGSFISEERPSWVNVNGEEVARRVSGVDVLGKAGTAVLFNNASFHCRTDRQTEQRRRTVRARYRLQEPAVSRHAIYDPWVDVADFTSALPDRPALRPPPSAAAKM